MPIPHLSWRSLAVLGPLLLQDSQPGQESVPQQARDTGQERVASAPPPAPAARPLLLRGGTVHSMLPGDPPRVADVWIEDGHIRALGPEAASASDPLVLDVRGKHLLPGLIDAHVNFDPDHDALYLAAGITLVRDLGGDHFALYLERAPERRERVPGPTLLTAGAALDGDPPASAAAVVLRNADSATGYLPILFEEGIDFLSVLPGLPEDSWRQTLVLAKERDLPVFGPRPARLALAEAIAAGQGGFHGLDSLLPVGVFWDRASTEAVGESIVALAAARKPLVPLLEASALRLEDQSADPSRRALTGLLAPTYEAWWRAELDLRRPFLAPERRALGELTLEKQARALRALFDAGAVLLPGSGSPQPWCLPGTGLHLELQQWVRAGIPSAMVLELATRGAAEALGLAGQRGTLQPGAWADLLVLDADPTADLANLLDPAWVVLRGRALSRADIEERLDTLGRRQAALRDELAGPVELDPPPQGEVGVVLLEGTVQSDSYGLRVSTERYKVVRLASGALLFSGRILFPATPQTGPRELTLEQFVRAGRLEQIHAVLLEGGSRLEYDGLWTAGTWRMQTRLDGQLVNSPAPFREQPACIDAGSVTSFLILGQLPASERLPIVQLHPGFDAEPVNWRTERDEQDTLRIRTNVGYKAFRLDESGALLFALTKIGPGSIETRSLASGTLGPGLPGFGGPAETRAAPTAASATDTPGSDG